MHRLQDMRAYESGPTASHYVFEVDRHGTPTNLVQVETYAGLMPPLKTSYVAQYKCACDQTFGSCEEAKDHIIWDDE